MKILVVEDDETIARFLEHLIREKGHGVDVALDGQAGLQLLRQGGYQLVFMDHNMPELTGLELLHQIKQESWAVKTVMMTGYEEIDDFFVKALGADEYLRKPFTAKAVEEILSRYAR